MEEPVLPTPPADLLGRPVLHTFKDDARSTVWRVVDDAGGAWVVKRFNASPLSQRWRLALRVHPQQRELRWHRQLAKARVPVVPHAAHGVDGGGRSWVATADAGPSLHQVLAGRADASPARRRALTREAGVLTGALLSQRAFNRDHKVSNLVTGGDAAGPVRLIDAGAAGARRARRCWLRRCRRSRRSRRRRRWPRAKHPDPAWRRISRTDRLRFFRAVLAAWPTPPDGLQHLPRHREFSRAKTG